MPRSLEQKIISSERLPQLIKQLKDQGKRIISTNGCFDILHLGHINYLNEARHLGDILFVGINSDLSVKRLKGQNRPINNEKIRALQLSALEAVDYVTVFTEDNPELLLRVIQPSIHVKGGDYNPNQLPEKSIVEANGGKVVCLSMTEGFSTTELIKKLSKE